MKVRCVLVPLLAVACVAGAADAAAQVYKCTDAAGKVSYQNIPCTGVKQEQPVILSSGRPGSATGSSQPKGVHVPYSGDSDIFPQEEVRGAYAYRCTREDGRSEVRRMPCPQTATVAMKGELANGTAVSGQHKGAVKQEALSRGQACEAYKAQRDQLLKDYQSRREAMPYDTKKKIDAEVFEICG